MRVFLVSCALTIQYHLLGSITSTEVEVIMNISIRYKRFLLFFGFVLKEEAKNEVKCISVWQRIEQTYKFSNSQKVLLTCFMCSKCCCCQ